MKVEAAALVFKMLLSTAHVMSCSNNLRIMPPISNAAFSQGRMLLLLKSFTKSSFSKTYREIFSLCKSLQGGVRAKM